MYEKQLAVLNRDLSVACAKVCMGGWVGVCMYSIAFSFHFNYTTGINSANIFTHFKFSAMKTMEFVQMLSVMRVCVCMCACVCRHILNLQFFTVLIQWVTISVVVVAATVQKKKRITSHVLAY